LECPNCPEFEWVIVGGGQGLLPGWGRWKCKRCGYKGIAPFEQLHAAKEAVEEAERQKRIAAQEAARSKYSNKQRYLNNWEKRGKHWR